MGTGFIEIIDGIVGNGKSAKVAACLFFGIAKSNFRPSDKQLRSFGPDDFHFRTDTAIKDDVLYVVHVDRFFEILPGELANDILNFCRYVDLAHGDGLLFLERQSVFQTDSGLIQPSSHRRLWNV